MTAPPVVLQLRLVFYPSPAEVLHTFAVFDGVKLVAFGFVGNEVCLAMNDSPSLWYHTPGKDVLAAVRARFSSQRYTITIDSAPQVDSKASASPGGVA